jgi:phage/plasmid-associated DNA primase
MIDPSKHIYEKDEFLEDKLKLHTWRTGFLSLLVHYYDTEYLAHGLREPDCVTAASNKYKEINDMFMSFFTDTYVREPGAGPVNAKDVKTSFRDWKRAFGKVCDLKDHQVLERLKLECGGGSTEKEFWGIREITEDLSGALMP